MLKRLYQFIDEIDLYCIVIFRASSLIQTLVLDYKKWFSSVKYNAASCRVNSDFTRYWNMHRQRVQYHTLHGLQATGQGRVGRCIGQTSHGLDYLTRALIGQCQFTIGIYTCFTHTHTHMPIHLSIWSYSLLLTKSPQLLIAYIEGSGLPS